MMDYMVEPTIFFFSHPTVVTCEPLENLANGFVETEGNEYGSTARYQCERGFRLQGEAERKCGPDGLWTGYAPTCQGKLYTLCRWFRYIIKYTRD